MINRVNTIGSISVVSLDSEPSLQDLMSYVAAVIPSKYEMIGLQLGVTLVDLDTIRSQHQSLDDYRGAFRKIFVEWEGRRSPPYTWRTLIAVLRSASVGEVQLSERLTSRIASTSGVARGMRKTCTVFMHLFTCECMHMHV